LGGKGIPGGEANRGKPGAQPRPATLASPPAHRDLRSHQATHIQGLPKTYLPLRLPDTPIRAPSTLPPDNRLFPPPPITPSPGYADADLFIDVKRELPPF
jgi:hypothetical protein